MGGALNQHLPLLFCKVCIFVRDKLNFERLSAMFELKEVPLFAILTRNISSNFFPWVFVNMWLQFLKKNCMLPTFQKFTFCKGWWEENDGRLKKGNGARKLLKLQSDESLSWMLSRSIKNIYLIDLSIKQLAKLWRFLKNAGCFCIWVLQSIAVQLYEPMLIRWLSLLYVCK